MDSINFNYITYVRIEILYVQSIQRPTKVLLGLGVRKAYEKRIELQNKLIEVFFSFFFSYLQDFKNIT